MFSFAPENRVHDLWPFLRSWQRGWTLRRIWAAAWWRCSGRNPSPWCWTPPRTPAGSSPGRLESVSVDERRFNRSGFRFLPHRCRLGSKLCERFGSFYVEWLPLPPGEGDIFWTRSCEKGQQQKNHIIYLFADFICLQFKMNMPQILKEKTLKKKSYTAFHFSQKLIHYFKTSTTYIHF